MNRAVGLVPPDDRPVDRTGGVRLRDTLRQGGWAVCLLAVPLVVMEQLSREATNTLAPDIRDHFGISDALLVALAGFTGVALTLGGLPMAWLADRVRRKHLVVVSAAVGAPALVGAGLAQNTWQLLLAYTFTGLAASYSNPVFGSLIADAYPVGGRGRVFSLYAMGGPLGQAVGPVLAGAVAGAAGDSAEAWRWAYLALAAPYALLAVAAGLLLEEPERGRADRSAPSDADRSRVAPVEPPVGTLTAFRRMMKVRTFLFMCLGIGVLGLALYTVPVQMSVLLGDEYGFDALTRGSVFTLTQIPVIAAMIVGGRRFDRTYRRRPERTVHVAGTAILAFGALIVVGVWLRPIALLLACYVLASVCVGIALVAVHPLVASVTPRALRAQAFALMPVFTFLMGGFFGSVFAGVISDAHGPRAALTVAVAVSAFVAGFLFLRGGRFLTADIDAAGGSPSGPPG
ncbi:MFS family permease [Saccharothrix tamanrassetensis]|uniref:MFS family permease n=1 Tax=Saccharothrix tamanrassetensis TaxID=1051531 RepID=A0A841CBH3_9PSEU|nr:MFS transporter [Saccharothrix tamanrassetensis]MBB5953704.1 MFS family permease [Saccharothrix tamanrassetensis]